MLIKALRSINIICHLFFFRYVFLVDNCSSLTNQYRNKRRHYPWRQEQSNVQRPA